MFKTADQNEILILSSVRGVSFQISTGEEQEKPGTEKWYAEVRPVPEHHGIGTASPCEQHQLQPLPVVRGHQRSKVKLFQDCPQFAELAVGDTV